VFGSGRVHPHATGHQAAQWRQVNAPLSELLRQQADPAREWVEQAIFGTSDPGQIARCISSSVRELVGVPVRGGTFYGASAGCVFGLELTDGRSLVCKVYQAHWEMPFLQATQRVQRAVRLRGFACPAPIAGPVRLGHGLVTLESFLPDSGLSRPDGTFLGRSSTGLAQLIAAAAGVDHDGLDRHPFRIDPGQIYPTPHSPIFDLAGTSGGAQWIDDIARSAWRQRESHDLPQVIAHMDWSARNVRFDQFGISAVYDWDSLSLAPEAVAAGQSAATWRSTGEAEDRHAPGADEIDRFLHSFGAARGTPLSASEWSAARGAAVWVMAYAARCEHALEQRTPYRRHRARDWLETQAERLLTAGGSVDQ
jgi:Phosphotransferase enzyme family